MRHERTSEWSKYESLDTWAEQEARKLSIGRTQQNELEANYEQDGQLRKIIQSVSEGKEDKRWTFGKEWGKVWKCLRVKTSVQGKSVLYMDNKLVIPKDMRAELKNSVHFGHPGRNAMFERVKEFWWPQIYADICAVTEFCAD